MKVFESTTILLVGEDTTTELVADPLETPSAAVPPPLPLAVIVIVLPACDNVTFVPPSKVTAVMIAAFPLAFTEGTPDPVEHPGPVQVPLILMFFTFKRAVVVSI